MQTLDHQMSLLAMQNDQVMSPRLFLFYRQSWSNLAGLVLSDVLFLSTLRTLLKFARTIKIKYGVSFLEAWQLWHRWRSSRFQLSSTYEPNILSSSYSHFIVLVAVLQSSPLPWKGRIRSVLGNSSRGRPSSTSFLWKCSLHSDVSTSLCD